MYTFPHQMSREKRAAPKDARPQRKSLKATGLQKPNWIPKEKLTAGRKPLAIRHSLGGNSSVLPSNSHHNPGFIFRQSQSRTSIPSCVDRYRLNLILISQHHKKSLWGNGDPSPPHSPTALQPLQISAVPSEATTPIQSSWEPFPLYIPDALLLQQSPEHKSTSGNTVLRQSERSHLVLPLSLFAQEQCLLLGCNLHHSWLRSYFYTKEQAQRCVKG